MRRNLRLESFSRLKKELEAASELAAKRSPEIPDQLLLEELMVSKFNILHI